MTRIILVTGGQGQVGQELARFDWPQGIEPKLPGRDELNLGDRDTIERYVAQLSPAAIINCAAYTSVDRAEDEPNLAYAVNARGAGWLARAARITNIPMIQVSTDYVFGAISNGVLNETTLSAHQGSTAQASLPEKLPRQLPAIAWSFYERRGW